MASKTLREMLDLLAKNNQYSAIIPDQLMIAIFWEETLFQNIERRFPRSENTPQFSAPAAGPSRECEGQCFVSEPR